MGQIVTTNSLSQYPFSLVHEYKKKRKAQNMTQNELNELAVIHVCHLFRGKVNNGTMKGQYGTRFTQTLILCLKTNCII